MGEAAGACIRGGRRLSPRSVCRCERAHIVDVRRAMRSIPTKHHAIHGTLTDTPLAVACRRCGTVRRRVHV
ncbi:hypothetical protein CA831_33095, partial [Burkholderia multivorans]